MKYQLRNFLIFFLMLSIAPAFSQTLNYHLKINKPEKHLAQVEISFETEGRSQVDIALPAWAPGRYVIYNFSKNVFDLKALDENGKSLPVLLKDKQSWRITCTNTKTVTIQYRVFANTLDGTFSKITAESASINGAGIFMYLVDGKNLPIQIQVSAPDKWQVVSSMDQETNGSFIAENYDQLVDSPIEMGKLSVYKFKCLTKEHRLVFHQPIKDELLKPFQEDLKKVIQLHANLFDGSLPYEHYTFFFHLDEELERVDGMEHRNSCRVLLRINPDKTVADANTNDAYDNLIWLSAHEYFHTWNIKRIHPAGLGLSFNYSQEVYTKSLWLVEGLTSYYAYLALIRSNIYNTEKFLSEFSGRIRRYEHDPGKTHRSLEEVSMLTWLFKGYLPQYEQTNVDETTYSYYYKGLVVGLLLDLKIRAATNNQKSLDTIMKAMYQRFYLDKTGFESGYTEEEFETLAEEVSAIQLKPFFEKTLRSTQALPYQYLNSAGLDLVISPEVNYQIKQLNTPTQKQQDVLKGWLGQ